MPGLVVFNRRWSIGSDDLAVPAITLAFLNSVWVIALTVMLIKIYTDEDLLQGECPKGFLWYPCVTLGLLVLLIIAHTLIAVHSGRGGVFDTKARSKLPCLCYIRTALLVLEIVWACSGCALLSWKLRSGQCSTSDMMYIMMCVVVGSNMVVIFLTLLTVYMSFDSAGRTFTKFQNLHQVPTSDDLIDGDSESRKLRSKYEEKWTSRVSAGCCCASLRKPSDKTVFKKIAILLTDYLNNLDVVLSDFIAGMVLLRKQQKALCADTVQQPTNDVYQYLSGTAISPRTKFLTLKDENTQSEFHCMVHFAEYAVAGYGYQGQCFFYPCKACCKINICGRCPGCPNRHDARVLLGDNCCQCQYAAITKCSPLLYEDDFVYGNYENKPNFPSYYVCLDHAYKKVVLCIRGTLSIRDALIDLQGDDVELNGNNSSWKGHRGMVLASENIYTELIDKQILESAFARCQTIGYRLLVTGHSLGAGVAAIISFRLREKYPQLYCYAFSPPGGLLSQEAMEESKSFTTSIVIGKDVIPRLGLSQLEYFRSDVFSLLENSPTPKWRILMSGLPLFKHCTDYSNTYSLPSSRSQNYNPFFSRTLSSSHENMYMPGRVLHIVKNYPKDSHKSKPLYQAVWADNASFDSIIVSPSMIDDHLPDNVLKAMQKVLENHGPKKPEKMLSEEERRATLRFGEDDDEIRSNGTGLSWEYTCQMEASVALHHPGTEHTESEVMRLISNDNIESQQSLANGNTDSTRLLTNGKADTPTQWLPAPLASEEDLLSIHHSTYSLSSHKGLLESNDESHTRIIPRSRSESECIRYPSRPETGTSISHSIIGSINPHSESHLPITESTSGLHAPTLDDDTITDTSTTHNSQRENTYPIECKVQILDKRSNHISATSCL